MNLFTRFFKRLTCKHTAAHRFIRNIYGDEINYANARSVWQCPDCNKYLYKPELNRSKEAELIDLAYLVYDMPVEVQRNIFEMAGYALKEKP